MRRAVIVGGGIGGLAVAIALRKVGYEAHVYERSAELREVGSGMSLWPNAMRCLREIAPRTLEKLQAGNQPLLRLLMKDTDGAVAKAIQFPASDFTAIGVHRAELHSALAELIPSNCLHLDHTFSSLQIHGRSAVVKFSNGAETEADLVVGSDGIRSAVRAAMGLDCTLSRRGYVVWRGMSRVVAQSDLNYLGFERAGDFSESYGHGQRVGIIHMGPGRVHWYATANISPREWDLLLEEEVFERFSSWHAPIPELIRNSESIVLSRVHDRLSSLPWTKGPVALLGDAAHPVSPDFGQGACLAIEDAVVLAASLKSNARISEALARYEKARHRRCREIVLTSREMGRLAQIQNRALVQIRKQVFSIAPAAFTTFWFQRCWNFHPPSLATT
jgi:2-polyprenyl-6-methoxyphenol hydroxylase-like FAD-dependent oxidoreductase